MPLSRSIWPRGTTPTPCAWPATCGRRGPWQLSRVRRRTQLVPEPKPRSARAPRSVARSWARETAPQRSRRSSGRARPPECGPCREHGEQLLTERPADAGDALAWILLSNGALCQGHLETADRAARKTVRLAPELGESWYALAEAELARNRPADGLAAAVRAAERAPSFVRALWVRLVCARVVGDTGRAPAEQQRPKRAFATWALHRMMLDRRALITDLAWRVWCGPVGVCGQVKCAGQQIACQAAQPIEMARRPSGASP